MISGPLIHEGVLDELYKAHAQFWRPELNQEPPDLAALMPRWIATGLIGSFLIAGVYGVVRSSFDGAGWLKGLKYGLVLFLISISLALGWSGVFNLPDELWVWWTLESLFYFLVGGMALGWFADKYAAA
ncbi:MAG: hypothetical protein IIA05_01290 [Proteobacteria bacterium]|nr:hypothetical protein [Pseudomonadota bacterium]